MTKVMGSRRSRKGKEDMPALLIIYTVTYKSCSKKVKIHIEDGTSQSLNQTQHHSNSETTNFYEGYTVFIQ